VNRPWRARLRSRGARSGPREHSDGDSLATLVHRLAVLLGAGVGASQAWRHAARGPLESDARAVGAARPAEMPAAIARMGGDGARGLAACWAVASDAGAPLAGALRSYARLLRGFAAADRAARVALAGPTATSRLVLAMPFVALAFGALLGYDTIGVLLLQPVGWACLAVGAVLVAAAWRWNRRLLRGAREGERLPGLVLELLAIAMSGGVSVDRARSLVDRACERFGVPVDWGPVDEELAVAASAGAPVAELLRAAAEESRRLALARAAERSERLAVALMLPLGTCVLPAFALLGVVPLLVALVADTIGAGGAGATGAIGL